MATWGGPGEGPVEAAGRRPRVRVNQLGYLVDGPKRATLVTDAVSPLPFEVELDGRTVATGVTSPWPVRPDPSSGLAVHVIDFGEVRTSGPAFTLRADGAVSHPFAIATDVYGGLCRDALRFFFLQRSGIEIDDAVAPGYGRPAGHAGVPPNRGDTRVRAWTGPDAERLYPGWHEGGEFDVSGGWYDAGDHGKYVPNGGLSVAHLLSAFEREAGRRQEGRAAMPRDLRAALLEEARWELDWMLRMQLSDGHPLAGMAFHRVHDDVWTPLPTWPHLDPVLRVLHRPSTAATLNLAAAAAQAARLYLQQDPAYASRLLAAARRAYDAALAHPGLLAPADAGAFGGGPYDDAQLDDEFYWAATELFLTTGERRYLEAVRDSACHDGDIFDPDGFDWNTVAAPARLDLARLAGDLPEHPRLVQSLLDAADGLVALAASQPWGQPYAPSTGWDWGSNGRVLSNLGVLAAAFDVSGQARYLDAAVSGIDYLLGRNACGLSFVTGHGTDHSHHQRTRHFAHDLDPAFPPPPPGALAGGPNSKTYAGFPSDERLRGLPPQFCYLDEPTSEVTNDVCIRWNAALVWVTAFLAWR